MSGDIIIAKVKPVRSSQFYDLIVDCPGFIRSAPSGIGICQAAQCVTHGIQVWANAETHMIEIITHIDNNRQLIGSQVLGKAVS